MAEEFIHLNTLQDLKCETYSGLGYWTPEGYWRYPIGSLKKVRDMALVDMVNVLCGGTALRAAKCHGAF